MLGIVSENQRVDPSLATDRLNCMEHATRNARMAAGMKICRFASVSVARFHHVNLFEFDVNHSVGIRSIGSGCDTVQTPNNSIIEEQNGGASISLHCMYGFQLVGNKEAYCDGLRWDRILGTCRLADSATRTECDFEAADQCGWENDLENSYDWKRRNGFSTFNAFESGPTHDHTSGKPLMGHYMVAEATGTRNTQVARLVSPIYNHTISTDACFRMFSHMYGATVGDLNVYLKPEGFTMTTLKYTPR